MLSKFIGPNFEAQADLIEYSNNLEFFYKLLAGGSFKIGPRKCKPGDIFKMEKFCHFIVFRVFLLHRSIGHILLFKFDVHFSV